MNSRCASFGGGVFLAYLFGACLFGAVALAQEKEKENPTAAEIRKSDEAMVKAFNAGSADELSGWFLAQAELVDEEGNVYQGKEELSTAFKKFFTQFPGAKLAMTIDATRTIGPGLAVTEGTRLVTAGKEGEGSARLRYVAVRSKSADGKWLFASLREYNDDPEPTPHERLQGLAWLVGSWMNEGSDGKVSISFRWSEDKNYLLGDYQIDAKRGGMKSTQRLGWDPSTGRIRSWLFDADGGFSEGTWTPTEEGFLVRSHSVNPDGSLGSATLLVNRQAADRFSIKGTHRVVGEQPEPDFEVVVTKRPPAAGK